MKTWRRAARLTVVLSWAWVTVAWVTGCSRQLPVPGSRATADSAHLPFDRVSDNSGIAPTEGIAPEGIPVGTAFIVRLQSELSSAHSRAGDSFQAVLDEPIVAGKIMLPRGTPVTGSVIAAKPSAGARDPGYLRVTLVAVAISGQSAVLQTSSIFAKGGPHEKRRATMKTSVADSKDAATQSGTNEADPSPIPSPGDVKFSTGHRFSFRLAQPLPVQH